MRPASCIWVILLFLSAAGIAGGEEADMKITSSAFEHNESIPSKYTCDGKNVSPPLKIEGAPTNAKSLALIMDDPDAPMGTFVHWVLWNIPPGASEIKENSVPEGASQGISSYRRQDYGGPCPPSGTHRYFFKLYALDTVLALSDSSQKADLEKAMKGHIIAQGELIGLYRRK